jgi:hypothetical protein
VLKIRARWIVKLGRKQPTDERMKAIVEDIALGLSYELISEKYGITKPRITAIRKLAGLPARR